MNYNNKGKCLKALGRDAEADECLKKAFLIARVFPKTAMCQRILDENQDMKWRAEASLSRPNGGLSSVFWTVWMRHVQNTSFCVLSRVKLVFALNRGKIPKSLVNANGIVKVYVFRDSLFKSLNRIEVVMRKLFPLHAGEEWFCYGIVQPNPLTFAASKGDLSPPNSSSTPNPGLQKTIPPFFSIKKSETESCWLSKKLQTAEQTDASFLAAFSEEEEKTCLPAFVNATEEPVYRETVSMGRIDTDAETQCHNSS